MNRTQSRPRAKEIDTMDLVSIIAAFHPAAALGIGPGNDLPGSLAVTALLLLVIAAWSVSGARSHRRSS